MNKRLIFKVPYNNDELEIVVFEKIDDDMFELFDYTKKKKDITDEDIIEYYKENDDEKYKYNLYEYKDESDFSYGGNLIFIIYYFKDTDYILVANTDALNTCWSLFPNIAKLKFDMYTIENEISLIK